MSAPLGARVENVDVNDLSEAQFAEIHALFLQHHVLAFPGQTLSIEQHLAFGQRWGKLVRHPYAGMKDYPDVIELKNAGKRHETPNVGGDTAFANQVLAYGELSDGLKAILANMTAEHSAADLARIYKADSAEAPRATHPVVRTHDESGEKALYVCRAFTEKFTGWSRRESEGLLNTLIEQSTRPEYQGRHQWQPGDLLMWDNRSVLHYAVHDHGDEPRLIHRLQVEGDIPI